MSQARWIPPVLVVPRGVCHRVPVVPIQTAVVLVCPAAVVIPATAKQVSFHLTHRIGVIIINHIYDIYIIYLVHNS